VTEVTGTTLRERLQALHPGVSGRRLKRWLEESRVRVNGAVVRRGDVLVRAGDRVELGAAPPPPFPAALRLVHADGAIIVVDKPAGLLTIATPTEREQTAYRLVRDWVAALERGARIFIVHRLDRETSGLLVFARWPAGKRHLQAQFAGRTAERVYVALVEGVVREPAGTFADRLVEDRSLRVKPAGPGRPGRDAVTRWRVRERFPEATLLELTLVTGRRGQIRAQCAAAGHPIVGDRAYGSRRDPLRRVCLHAVRLGFVHPDGHRVSFESPVPRGFRRS
jgi:RluA family pseudouridine synthase